MINIRKIIQLDGTEYKIGDVLYRENKSFVIESLNLQCILIGDMEFPVVRIYVVESGSPYMDIPYHAISILFYS